MAAGSTSRSPAPALRVREARSDDPAWLDFVQGESRALVYHHPAWIDVLGQEYSQDAVCLMCEDADNRISGILPLVYTRGLPFGIGGELTARRLSSLPRTPVAGPLARDREALRALLAAAIDRIDADGGRQFQVKAGGPELEGLVDGLAGKPWRTSYVLPLPNSHEELRFGDARNHARITWSIRRAAKLGVRVRPAEKEQELKAWYRIYLETMRLHAVPPRPYRLFAAMWEILRPRDLMRLLIAERQEGHETQIVAGIVLLMFGETVFYAFAGAHREALGLRPNEPLHWQAIRDACEEGFARYDLGEVGDDNPGLAEFKAKWGAETYRLYRYYYPQPAPDRPSESRAGDRALTIASAAWRRLPLRTTELLGERIYGYL
jgi:CelD/BcsL family acetyltransferase involved in cellulose biosynthesis